MATWREDMGVTWAMVAVVTAREASHELSILAPAVAFRLQLLVFHGARRVVHEPRLCRSEGLCADV